MALNGIDISSWQAGINTAAVPSDFVIIKATQGTGYVNHDCDRAYQQAKAAGKLLGVYHYASGGGAQAEAQHFLNNISGYLGEAILVLDWESGENAAWSQGVAYAKAFLDYIKTKTGIAPLIYMSKSVCRQYNWSSVASDYGLWAAQYPNYNRTGYQSNPWTDGAGWGAWSSPVIYQYSSSGSLSGWGGNLDLNIAYMDAAAWKRYAGAKQSQAGWIKDSVGWWYRHSDGGYTKSDWEQIGGSWYYFNEKGYAVENQWIQWKGDWYYLESDCRMCTGWKLWNGFWYHLAGSGKMTKGFLEEKGNTYYLNNERSRAIPEGAMLTGLREINGKLYHFADSGKLEWEIDFGDQKVMEVEKGKFKIRSTE